VSGPPHEHEHDHDQGPEDDHHRSSGGRLRSFFHRHETALPFDSALESSARGTRVLWLSLVVLGLTALVQLVVAMISGSVALLNDTFHNAADALTALPLWLAFTVGRRPPTTRYTYGYGRAEDVAGILVVAAIAASAAIAFWQAVDRLVDPTPVHHLGAVMAASVVGFAGNELVARYRITVGRAIGSAALVADGLHARTDGLSSLGVLAGALGVAAGFERSDALAGLGIAILILVVLQQAAKDVLARLMDAIDPGLVTQARSVLSGVDGVEEVGRLRVRWIGHRLHAEAEVVVDADVNLVVAHDIAERARHGLLHGVPRLASAIVHADPCGHDGRDHHAALDHHERG
jgi:cation diffusion facilitator family transporter